MNIYSKPLQLSLILHGILLLALINLNMSTVKPQNILVVDFSIENEPFLREEGTTVASLPKELQKNLKHGYLIPNFENQHIEEQKPITPPEIPDKKDILQNEPRTSVVILRDNNHDTFMSSNASFNLGSQTSIGESGLQKAGSSVPADGGDGDVISSDKSRYMKVHFSYIKDHIYKHLIYPVTAKRMGWEGRVIVSFIVSSGGYARDIRISKSSGYEILDKNAVKAIKNASPFPKPPVEAQIIIPILYRIN
jgi:periplasmic protein TonB